MRKLLNTLYMTNEDLYLGRDRENIVVKQDNKVIKRFPVHILEGIVCFNYIGVSPGVMKLTSDNNISITFMTPNGRFCGKFIGMTNGNVLLRRTQYRIADDEEESVRIANQCIKAKIINSRKLFLRVIRDHADKVNQTQVDFTAKYLRKQIENIDGNTSLDSLRGIEGDAARQYFQAFDELILYQKEDFKFVMRSRRPPLNKVNAILSYLYSLLTYEVQAALESVGLDSYVGFYHTDRPGRASLALDMVEELRAFMEDRFVLTLINRKQINSKDFEEKESGAVLLNDKGRQKVLEAWQKRKHSEITHPFIKERIPVGLIPYVQAQLLSRYIRNDIEEYPPFLA